MKLIESLFHFNTMIIPTRLCFFLQGFQLEFYVHDPHQSRDAAPKYIGFAHILPVNQSKSLNLRLRVPIMGLKHKPIGEVNGKGDGLKQNNGTVILFCCLVCSYLIFSVLTHH